MEAALTAEDILGELATLGSESKKIVRRVKTNYQLALDLYATRCTWRGWWPTTRG